MTKMRDILPEVVTPYLYESSQLLSGLLSKLINPLVMGLTLGAIKSVPIKKTLDRVDQKLVLLFENPALLNITRNIDFDLTQIAHIPIPKTVIESLVREYLSVNYLKRTLSINDLRNFARGRILEAVAQRQQSEPKFTISNASLKYKSTIAAHLMSKRLKD